MKTCRKRDPGVACAGLVREAVGVVGRPEGTQGPHLEHPVGILQPAWVPACCSHDCRCVLRKQRLSWCGSSQEEKGRSVLW